ncbi:MAG: hypothetical protein QF464_10165, partial [Myxococcota bacterium]|nr:hypothetical protein [Myxococcota bacterium]
MNRAERHLLCTAWCRTLLVSAIALWSCGAPADTGTNGGERTLVTVTLTPDWVAPEGEVVLRVVVPDAPGLQESAWISYEGGNLEAPLTHTDDLWVGELILQAPARQADHRVDVRAYYTGGEAVGYALLAVSEQPACPEGEHRQGGACYPGFEGGLTTDNRRLLRTNRHGDQRTMAHPRAIYRVEDKLIGC